jgi:hypothetical protein
MATAGPTSSPVGTSTQSTLSEYAGPYVTSMLGKAQALSEQPYQVYQGPMTAGESALQSKYFTGLGGLTFPTQLGQSFSSSTAPTLPTATGPAGSTTPTGPAAQYMNPYLQAVLAPQLEELRRQAGITQQTQAGKAAQAGAFGGTRYGLMEAEGARNLMQEMNKTIGTGYATAYDKAMQQFNAEQGQAKTLADMIASAGAQQRGIEQEGITADYNEFLAQRDYPMKQLQFQQSMLQGLPISTVSTSQAQQSGIGQLASTAGSLGTIYDLLKKLGVTG